MKITRFSVNEIIHQKEGIQSAFDKQYFIIAGFNGLGMSTSINVRKKVMKQKLHLTIFLIILLSFNQIEAQDRWSGELRLGSGITTENSGNTDLSTGYGLDGTFSYRFMPHLSAYAGWGWKHFSSKNDLAGSDTGIEETGYTFGLRFVHPIGETNFNYLVSAGGIYKHIEVENGDGDIVQDSGHGLGWQVESGLVIPVSDNLSVVPSISYHSLSRTLEIDNENTPVDLNYVSVGVGFSWSF